MNNTIKLSDKFNLDQFDMEVTPADWTILMISFIYLWQGVWLCYSVALLCRKVDEEYHYVIYPVPTTDPLRRVLI